ncbi:PREDICTED: olfactory receptor 52A1-like [Nanorana parkeri]|uniref:olfactory receptor 52A1-like n=1 Tax=Nanorana parkeri TaxID=125878 RepID=UPI0008541DA4|nr:PREDICTED: olfactory receptor 52A1-like [Nanorana parkeri]
MNSSGIQPNITKVSTLSVINMEFIRMVVIIPMCICFFFFLIFLGAMLTIFFTNSVAQETARYILFVHMLINDTVYLTLALLLFVLYFYQVTLPFTFCYIIVTLTSTSLKVTPYNLAVMSLERYVAICFPLRHGEICTVRRTFLAIALVWTIGLIPNVIDFIVLSSSVQKSYFLLYIRCSRSTFTITAMQEAIRIFAHALTFSLAGLTILFTYIRITILALKIVTGKASVTKAAKTMMLHSIQLVLCMSSFGSTAVELLFKDNAALLPVINFCFFMCLPRFLSLLIYGVRDELFLGYIKRYLVCNASKMVPNSAT